MRNEMGRRVEWSQRGKTFKAKTFAALKELYSPQKPGSEPKGVTTERKPKDAQSTPESVQASKTSQEKEQE